MTTMNADKKESEVEQYLLKLFGSIIDNHAEDNWEVQPFLWGRAGDSTRKLLYCVRHAAVRAGVNTDPTPICISMFPGREIPMHSSAFVLIWQTLAKFPESFDVKTAYLCRDSLDCFDESQPLENRGVSVELSQHRQEEMVIWFNDKRKGRAVQTPYGSYPYVTISDLETVIRTALDDLNKRCLCHH